VSEWGCVVDVLFSVDQVQALVKLASLIGRAGVNGARSSAALLRVSNELVGSTWAMLSILGGSDRPSQHMCLRPMEVFPDVAVSQIRELERSVRLELRKRNLPGARVHAEAEKASLHLAKEWFQR